MHYNLCFLQQLTLYGTVTFIRWCYGNLQYIYVQVEMGTGTQGTLKTIFNEIILSYCFVKTYNPFYLVSELELVNNKDNLPLGN